MKQKIVITGANGLLGSAIARKMVAEDHEVYLILREACETALLADVLDKVQVLQGDILDIFSLEAAIQPDDVVIHAAAMVSFSPKEQEKMVKTNVEGTTNVVNICLSQKASKLIFISSVAAIGRPSMFKKESITTINEEQKWEESPLNTFYAKTKYLAECEVWRGVAEGLNALVICPSVILGEGDWTRSSTQLFKYVANENRFYTGGIVNYVDAKDVATAIHELNKANVLNERFILSAGQVSYKILFETIAACLHKKAPSTLVKPWLAAIIWRLEAVRSFFTGKTPLITKETAHSAENLFYYDSAKLQGTIPFTFKTLEETINRICGFLKRE